MLKTRIIDALLDIGAIRIGQFQLKSGSLSPIYVDLRIIISFPDLLKEIAQALLELSAGLSFQKVAGIPYTALPIATAFSLLSGIPMIYSRKERKTYGTGQQIEGLWKPGEKVLVIDDLITTGASKLETFTVFVEAGLIVQDTVVLIDRHQGGQQRLHQAGYRLYSLLSIFEILDRLQERALIDEATANDIHHYLKRRQN